MKILINVSTIVNGGGLQVALNIIKQSFEMRSDDVEFCYILNNIIFSSNFLNNIKWTNKEYIIVDSPANFRKYFTIKKKILSFEKRAIPDVVYSVGSPSYINFETIQVQRLTNGVMFLADKLSYSVLPTSDKIRTFLRVVIQRLFVYKKNHIITQTQEAKIAINKTFKIPLSRIKVISNVVPSNFKKTTLNLDKNLSNKKVKILSVATPHLHKNLILLPDIAVELLKLGVNDFEFIVTLPLENAETSNIINKINLLKVEKHFVNKGVVDGKDLPKLYQESDLFFLPTLLDLFTVSFLESMISGIPVITTNRKSNKSICDDAALYFEPKNAVDAATKIYTLIEDSKKYIDFAKRGEKQIEKYSSTAKVYEEHINYLIYIFSKNK